MADQRVRFERRCQMCGTVFPEGTPASRKFCYDCLAIRHADQQKRHKEQQRQKREEEAASQTAVRPLTLDPVDKAYCSKCVYCGSFHEGYLCNYIIVTGNVRGCKAGNSCERRVESDKVEPIHGLRVCERCGSEYVGTRNATLCPSCRREVWNQKRKEQYGTWGDYD